MEEPYGTIFVSMPTMLDKTVAPKDRHIVHAFTPCWIEEWEVSVGSPATERFEQTAGYSEVRLFSSNDSFLSHFRPGCWFQCPLT
jgi:phytoene dehydrogenase-like protein